MLTGVKNYGGTADMQSSGNACKRGKEVDYHLYLYCRLMTLWINLIPLFIAKCESNVNY